MNGDTLGTVLTTTKPRELTREQVVPLHDALERLRAEIDAVLPLDARIGADVATEPFELLAHLRFYGEEASLYLENLRAKPS